MMSTNISLPRNTPEAQGVPSSAILAYLDGLSANNYHVHSIMLLRHGQVIAEGWWQPYTPDCKRYVYSLSKSFTSSAVGFAVAEGLLTVEDKVISFFPDDLPKPSVGEPVEPNLAAMRVKDLLTMTTGHTKDTTGALFAPGLKSWVAGILSLPVERQPGTLFVYNSGASYLLSAIVQTVTGQTVLDYLTPRLFQPLGITDITWETCPQGINTGGWGLNIRTEDIAKFGLLYAQKGIWNGVQILPAAWIEEATSAVVRNDGEGRDNDPTDWRQGYGYQFWRCQHNAYRGDGAFGQYCVVMPDQDVVLVITSDTDDMQSILDLTWEQLLPAMQTSALPEAPAMQAQLQQRLSSLTLAMPVKSEMPAKALGLTEKIFQIEANKTGIRSLAFTFDEKGGCVTMQEQTQQHILCSGNGKWVTNQTQMPFMKATMIQLVTGQKLQKTVKGAAIGTWLDADTYQVTLQYLETPHHEQLTFRFEADQVTMTVQNSMVGPDHPMAAQLETVFTGKAE